jgi:hypothetical protein
MSLRRVPHLRRLHKGRIWERGDHGWPCASGSPAHSFKRGLRVMRDSLRFPSCTSVACGVGACRRVGRAGLGVRTPRAKACHRGLPDVRIGRRTLDGPDLIGDRLDITGARWGLDGAEAILTLRAVISNGDLDDYWRYHLAQEHQRLYPGATQG